MNTKEKIVVMQAYEDGKQIQQCYTGYEDWRDVEEAHWNWVLCDYRIKQELKPVDLSVLIKSGVDCEFWDSGQEFHVIGKMIEVETDTTYKYVDVDSTNYMHCRPRMNHIHAIALAEYEETIPVVVRDLEKAGFKFNYKVVNWTDRILLIEFTGLADGYCWPWEVSDE